MSSAHKLEYPSYKLFEPELPYQRPIIVGVDERLESPDTVTLKYEEAVARANGGEVQGNSSPGLMSMSAYAKAQPPHVHGYGSNRAYQDPSFATYPPQTFPSQTPEQTSQINNESFVSNATVSDYSSLGPTILSYQPESGPSGSSVVVRISSQYDLLTMQSSPPYFSLVFGTEKCPAEVQRESQDGSGFVYTVTAAAPQFMVTGSQAADVSMVLVIEGAGGEELSRTSVGQFIYHDAPVGSTGASQGDLTRKDTKSPVGNQPDTPPRSATSQIASDSGTNNYDYTATQQQAIQSAYTAGFPQGNSNMIGTYRSASFTDQHYPRTAPPALRTPSAGWATYHTGMDGTRSPAIAAHTSMTRPSLTPLPIPTNSATPQLIRTSTLHSGSPGMPGGNNYNPYTVYPNKAVLKIAGKLETMAENWTTEEWENRRRIVLFRKSQQNSTLTATFHPVSVNDRPPNSICISCIWWEEKRECYVTSVDTIHLLEQLVATPARFTVEEKNRIRRNLEGFHPLTVSKSKRESEEFFKIIMAFPNPKPRNIEKDVKVFPWKILEAALKKIIGKYSASPSSTMQHSHLVTPVNVYPPLPTPPLAAGTLASDPSAAYTVHAAGHHDSLSSPRSMAGNPGSWIYAPAQPRALSPSIRAGSPQSSSLRLAGGLPAVSPYDGRGQGQANGSYSAGMHASLGHQASSGAATPRWDPTSSSYPESYANHQGQNAQFYGSANHTTYADGTPRT